MLTLLSLSMMLLLKLLMTDISKINGADQLSLRLIPPPNVLSDLLLTENTRLVFTVKPLKVGSSPPLIGLPLLPKTMVVNKCK